jgi:ATP-dependent DNA ligase
MAIPAMTCKVAFEPCIPTCGTRVPAGPDWLHEIKHDGYSLIVQRNGGRLRLFTRNGYDWSDRYPLIVEAALRNRSTSFVIDGQAVLLGVDGISDFNGLHSRRHNDEVQLYAFDILALEGDDLRKLPLHLRKTNLARLLAKRPEGAGRSPDWVKVKNRNLALDGNKFDGIYLGPQNGKDLVYAGKVDHGYRPKTYRRGRSR